MISCYPEIAPFWAPSKCNNLDLTSVALIQLSTHHFSVSTIQLIPVIPTFDFDLIPVVQLFDQSSSFFQLNFSTQPSY
jgi:hypothetical protein